MTCLVSEVFLLAAIIPWGILMLGLQYKVIQDENLHHYPMLAVDLLLNLMPALTAFSYIFYEIYKRRSNALIYKK